MADIPVNESTAETLVTVSYNGQTDIAFDFLIFEPDQIRVQYRPISGAEVELSYPSDFGVTGLNSNMGGSINLVSLVTSVGDTFYMWRDTPIEREKDWQTAGDYKAELVNREQDEIYMILQEMKRDGRNSSAAITDLQIGLRNEITARINDVSRLESLIGDGTRVMDAPFYESVSAAEIAFIAPHIHVVLVGGHINPGDGGLAFYKRVSVQPSHAGKFQSSDGSWWELTGNRVTPEMFGVFGSGLVDATPGLQAAVDYLEYRNGGILDIPAKIYLLMGTWRIPSNVKVFSAPNTIYRRAANTNCMLISKSDGLIGGYNAVSNITIIGGVFDCNKDNYPTPASSLAFGHCKDVSVDSIAVLNNSGRYHAIEINSQLRFKVTNSVFYKGGNDEVAGECLQIDGAYNSGVFPWYGPYDDTPCEDIVIAHNSFDEWATAIGTHSLPNGTTRHTKIDIRKNVMKVSRRGIVMQGWAGVKIIDNHISGIGAADGTSQMAIQGVAGKMVGHMASDITISGNTILNFTRLDDGSGNAGRGISMMGWQSASDAPVPTLQNVVITDNYLSGLGSHGIAIEAASNVFVANNTVIGIKGNGIYMYGTGRYIIQGNHVNSPTGKQAINLVAAHGRNPSEGVVTGNRAYPEIYSNAPGTVVCNNITNILNFGGLATGIKGANLVNGVVVP